MNIVLQKYLMPVSAVVYLQPTPIERFVFGYVGAVGSAVGLAVSRIYV